MSNALTVTPSQSLITEEDMKILRNTKFKGFSDGEVAYCAKIATMLNLSPFLNQIHFVRRMGKDGTASISAQVGIDGFRLAAQRAGGYAGQDEPAFTYHVDDAKQAEPEKATVVVYKIVQGLRCAFTGSARWSEYYPGKNHIWDKMQHTMLAKCAEALALRKAFPAELSGVYANEEMHQADNRPPSIRPEAPGPEDGFSRPMHLPYLITNGTYARKMFREIDLNELREYHDRQEAAIHSGKKIAPAWWDEFSREAVKYIAGVENETNQEGDSDF